MARSIGITLDHTSGTPLYQQIATEISSRIRSGAMPTGFRLPPTRQLAAELSTHRNTIVRAYDELGSAGLLQTTVGRGTFVQAPPVKQGSPLEVPERRPHPWGSLMSRAASSETLRRADRLRAAPSSRDEVNMTSMQPPPELRPHEQLRRCLDHVLRTRGPRALGYAPRGGVPQLRALIAADLSAGGVPATQEDVLITTGSQQALDLIARALIDDGDTFLVDESTYTGAINLLTAAGARLTGVPSDAEGPDPNALRRLVGSGAKGFYLMPNCGNPTGRCISTIRRRALVEWSHEANVPLIEDDYGADLNMDGVRPPPALRALDSQVIYVGTFSKKLIPALRVGFMVCPREMRKHLLPLKHAMDLGTSAVLQYALAEFIERGYLQAHIARTQVVYRERRDALCDALAKYMPEGVRWERPGRGLVLWLELDDPLTPETVFEAARRRGVLVTPGHLNSPQAQAQGGLRLVFCAEPPERLEEGAKRLGQAISDVRAGPRGQSYAIDTV